MLNEVGGVKLKPGPGVRKSLPRLRTGQGPAGLIILGAFVVMALLAPVLAPRDPYDQDLALSLMPPTLEHPLGTDQLGRDIASRVIYGSRISLGLAALSVVGGLVTGGTLGGLAGFFGGPFDSAVMRVMDVLMAFPGMLLALGIAAVLGPGLGNVAVAIGVFSLPAFARMARAAVISARTRDYVEAAGSVGAGNARILWRHIAPNSADPLIVLASHRMATAVLTASGLSFLGLGAPPSTPEWGVMLASGREYLRIAPHVALAPGLAIALLTVGLNLFGDWLCYRLDPRSW